MMNKQTESPILGFPVQRMVGRLWWSRAEFATVYSTVALLEPCVSRAFILELIKLERIQTATFFLCLTLCVLAALHLFGIRTLIREIVTMKEEVSALEEVQARLSKRLQRVGQTMAPHSSGTYSAPPSGQS